MGRVRTAAGLVGLAWLLGVAPAAAEYLYRAPLHGGAPVVAQTFRTCKELKDAGRLGADGLYEVTPGGAGAPLRVWCDATTQGGGWTLIQGHKMGALAYGAVGAQAVTPRSGLFQPTAVATALAAASAEVMIRDADSPATRWVRSRSGLPIAQLAAGKGLNNAATGDGTVDWTIGGGLAATVMHWNAASPACAGAASLAYPNLYWGCGSGANTHISARSATTPPSIRGDFADSALSINLDVLVR